MSPSELPHKVHAQLQLKDGTRLKETAGAGLWDEHDFECEGGIAGKPTKLADQVMPKSRAQQLCEWMSRPDKRTGATELARLLAN